MTRILGIDPGSQRTGIGVIDVAGDGRCTFVHAQAIVLLGAEDFPSRLGLLCEGLEALLVGIEGKRALWRALAIASEEVHELDGVDYDHLAQRAQEQHDRVEVLRLDAAKAALRATD